MSSLQCPATIIVVRHADASFEERFFSDEGGSLTPSGREQAVALAESLRGRNIAQVWSSDTSRAVQTAEIIAARLGTGVTARKSLREAFIGDLLGQPFSLAALDAVVSRWFEGDIEASFPHGESGTDVLTRFGKELGSIADEHRGETVVLVAHQNAISIALPSLAGNISPSYAGKHPLGNGESAELVIDSDDWTLTRWASRRLA